MRFGLLGMLEVFDGERRVTLSAPKVRSVLALLLLHSGRVVHTASLIDELWGENPPLTALTTLHTYIYQLRKAIPVRRATDAGPGEPAPTGTPQPQWLRTAYAGYVADIPPESIDLRQFESLAVQGKQALDRGVMAEAAGLLRAAQSCWRGPFAADVRHGRALSAYATKLDEEWLRVVEQAIEAEMALGLHREVLGELRQLVMEHPFSEGLYQQLMLALYRSDRRFDAIQEYQCLRRNMVDELGLEPSRAVRQLHEAILNSDPSLDFRYADRPRPRQHSDWSAH
ncbi:DNA-binding SARP family transcriptional activator [Streptomyces sp. TE3672]